MKKRNLKSQLEKLIQTKKGIHKTSTTNNTLSCSLTIPKKVVESNKLNETSLSSSSSSSHSTPQLQLKSKLKKKDNLPYTLSDRILLVGEGNFSFALALSTLFPSAWIVATSYDSKATVIKKYPESEALLTTLSHHVKVMHDVDATQWHQSKYFRRHRFTKIVFMFPHVGLGIKDQARNILANQALLTGFFKACRSMYLEQASLASSSSSTNHSSNPLKDLEVHVTLRTGVPYDAWDIKKIAKVNGFRVITSFAFDPDIYPGYEHRRTLGYVEGISKDANEEIKGKARTYLFMTLEKYQEHVQETNTLQRALVKSLPQRKKTKNKSGLHHRVKRKRAIRVNRK